MGSVAILMSCADPEMNIAAASLASESTLLLRVYNRALVISIILLEYVIRMMARNTQLGLQCNLIPSIN